MSGTVYLIGGGPGDLSLLTVGAKQCIEQADCILYDRLINPAMLSLTKPGCERIYVGKKDRHHTLRQEEINALLVQKAKEYSHVVRLKGGDVYVFGRGSEEGIYLREHGVSFEVIPGISSSIAGLCYAGIPITHRGTATGFRVMTAHDRLDQLTDLDFSSMTNPHETLVFLMGLSKVEEICNRLIAAGADPATAAAVISCATRSDQKTVVSTLSDLSARVKQEQLISPALIVVGAVVSLRNQLNFFEQRPLFGKKILVAKAGLTPSLLCERLQILGAQVTDLAVSEICGVQVQITKQQIQSYSHLVFTSKYGVRYFMESLAGSHLDSRALAGLTVCAVGSLTAASLSQYGIIADLVPDVFTAKRLSDVLAAQLCPSDRILLVGAKENPNRLMHDFEGQSDLLCVYQTRLFDHPMQNLSEEQLFDQTVFTCSSAARAVLSDVSEEQIPQLGTLVSMGESTTQTIWQHTKIDCVQADYATFDSVIDRLIQQNIQEEE